TGARAWRSLASAARSGGREWPRVKATGIILGVVLGSGTALGGPGALLVWAISPGTPDPAPASVLWGITAGPAVLGVLVSIPVHWLVIRNLYTERVGISGRGDRSPAATPDPRR